MMCFISGPEVSKMHSYKPGRPALLISLQDHVVFNIKVPDQQYYVSLVNAMDTTTPISVLLFAYLLEGRELIRTINEWLLRPVESALYMHEKLARSFRGTYLGLVSTNSVLFTILGMDITNTMH
jgi:hypothetical protein